MPHHFSTYDHPTPSKPNPFDIFTGQTPWKWDHLAIFNRPAASSNRERERFVDTSTADLDLLVRNIVAYFSSPYAFNTLHALVWDVVTTITVHPCSIQGTTANVSVAGLDPIFYKHKKMAVYRHNNTGLLQDVTRGTFVDGDSLTPITGKMYIGSSYSVEHSLADILRCQQSNINKETTTGKISDPGKGIDVIAVPPVQEDVNLTKVMRVVNNQYENLVNDWSVLEEEAPLKSQTSTASAIPNHDTDSDSPSSLEFDTTLSPHLHEGAGDANLLGGTQREQVQTLGN